MKYKQIVVFSIKEFNQNKEKEGKLPQEGEVINVTIYCPSVVLQHYVAVGYK